MRLHESRLRELGFSMSQMPVLIALEESGELSQKELARIARVEQPTMAELLARMERDGVVERKPNPDDKRASITSLSRRSRARMPKAKAELMQGEEDAMAGLSAEEQKLLVSLLRRVVQNLAPASAP